MRLVLDELDLQAIALELRRRGHDAISANEPGHRSRYASTPDDVVFARAFGLERRYAKAEAERMTIVHRAAR